MKKTLVLFLLMLFALQANASMLVSMNLIAANDPTIAQAPAEAASIPAAQAKVVSEALNEIKANITKSAGSSSGIIKPIEVRSIKINTSNEATTPASTEVVTETPVTPAPVETAPVIKKDIQSQVTETITKTKKVINEAGEKKITEIKEIITNTKETILGDKGEKEVMTSETKETIMESQPIEEVKKATKASKDTNVVLKTEKGDITVKLYLEKAPITAGNFLDLVNKGFYNGLTFHRLISGFMIQGGCPLGNGTGNYIDPKTKKARYIKHETHPELKHDKEGVLAMARTSDPDSASSQFFIDLGPQPFLDAGGADPYGYAVFGQVIEGMDVVHKIMDENVAPYPGSDGTSNPVKINTVEVLD